MPRNDILFEILSTTDTKDLLGNIDALLASSDDFVKVRDRLLISFIPLYPSISTYNRLGGFIRGMIASSSDVDAYIFGIAAKVLNARIKAFKFKNIIGNIFGYDIKDLEAGIFPIPPVDLMASIKAFKFEYLSSYIYGIPPIDLEGYIRGFNNDFLNLDGAFNSTGYFSNLFADIIGILSKDLVGSIRGYQFKDLSGDIVGYTPIDLYGEINYIFSSNLRASIQGKTLKAPFDLYARVRGLKPSVDDLSAVIRAIAHVVDNLSGDIFPILPKDLYGHVGINRPKDLDGIIYPSRVRRVFDRLLIEMGPTKDLLGAFTPYGGFKELIGIIRGEGSKFSRDLYASIDGFAQTDLNGYITPHRWKSLSGSIVPRGIDSLSDLNARFKAIFSKDILGYIYPNENSSTLPAFIAPSGASSTISAKITPDVAAFHDILVINTMMHKNLYGIIYSGTSCDPYSGFSNLLGRIRPNYEGETLLNGFVQPKPFNTTLYGSIVGGHSFPGLSDLYATVSSKGTYRGLNATISSPISYLKGAISGIGTESKDLGGSFKTYEWNVFLRGNITPRLLLPKSINNVSTQVYKKDISNRSILRDIQIKFASQGYEYVRSDLFANTFLVTGDTWGVRLSKFIPKINPDGYMQDLIEEKVKVFFDISGFNSFDEAMRYFIDFIAYGIKSDLQGCISSKGGFLPLYGKIVATDSNKLRNLDGKVYPVDLNLVTLSGLITGSGGLLDIQATIKAIVGASTDLTGDIYGYAQNDLQGYINSV